MVKGGNIQVQNMLEMGQLIQPLLMPPQVCDLVPAAAGALGVPVRDILYIPMDAASCNTPLNFPFAWAFTSVDSVSSCAMASTVLFS